MEFSLMLGFFKRPFLTGALALDRESCQFALSLMKNSNAAPADVGVVAVGTHAKDFLWRRGWGSAPRAIVFRHADPEPQFIRCLVVSLI
jgi:hypothetical protein